MKLMIKFLLAVLCFHLSLTAYGMTPENPTHFRLKLPSANIYGSLPVTGSYSSLCLSADTRTGFPSSLTYRHSGVLRSFAITRPNPLPGVRITPCNNSDLKQIFIYDGETIKNKATGRCLSKDYILGHSKTLLEQPVAGVRKLRGLSSLVVLRSCDGSQEQDWELMNVSSVTKKLYSNDGAGRCLWGDVYGYGTYTKYHVTGGPVVYDYEGHSLFSTSCSSSLSNWTFQVVSTANPTPPPSSAGTKKCFWVVTGCQMNQAGGCYGGSMYSALPSSCNSSTACTEARQGYEVDCRVSGGTATFQCNVTTVGPDAPPGSGPGVVCP